MWTLLYDVVFFFFSSRRRHTRCSRDWSSDVCSSDLFGDKPKDVVVMAGDGGMADIGFSMTLHSWFRKERFTTIMLDNEVYGNTGGQESGMTNKGQVLKMAPLGKKFEKMDMVGMAKLAGCAYVATVVPNNPRRVESDIKRPSWVRARS